MVSTVSHRVDPNSQGFVRDATVNKLAGAVTTWAVSTAFFYIARQTYPEWVSTGFTASVLGIGFLGVYTWVFFDLPKSDEVSEHKVKETMTKVCLVVSAYICSDFYQKLILAPFLVVEAAKFLLQSPYYSISLSLKDSLDLDIWAFKTLINTLLFAGIGVPAAALLFFRGIELSTLETWDAMKYWLEHKEVKARLKFLDRLRFTLGLFSPNFAIKNLGYPFMTPKVVAALLPFQQDSNQENVINSFCSYYEKNKASFCELEDRQELLIQPASYYFKQLPEEKQEANPTMLIRLGGPNNTIPA
jgi:hypothetical protein